ncbi:MAG: hypothetical protein ROZ36_00775 [Thermincola sp.]|nr:hypothetical protein [Thermincola sp.]
MRVGTISIVLIVALGTLGAGYASWSQQFDIFSTISTGNLNVEIKDVFLDSSDTHQSISFTAHKDGEIVDEVNMNVVTAVNPFGAVLVFTVQNNGTIPVTCTGIDQNAAAGLEVEIVESPPVIDVEETAAIKVRLTKGYSSDFQFSAFLRFEQAVN